jgi:hypothetical protein
MRRGILIAIGLMLTVTVRCNLASAAGLKEARLYWADLPGAILNERIALDLPDKTRVEGKVRAVQPDSLELKVEKTSNARLHPKKGMTIPRSDLAEFELRTERQHDGDREFGQQIGILLGTFIGALLGFAIGESGHENLGLAVFLGITLGGGALGDLAATRTDTEIILVKIISDPAANPAVVPTTGKSTDDSPRNDSETAKRVAMRRLVSETDRPMPPGEPAPPWPR